MMKNAFVTQLQLRIEKNVRNELELQGASSLPEKTIKDFVDARLIRLADLLYEHFRDQI